MPCTERIQARRALRHSQRAGPTIDTHNPHDEGHESGSGSGHYREKSEAVNIGIAIADPYTNSTPLTEIPLHGDNSPGGGSSRNVSTRHNIPTSATSSSSHSGHRRAHVDASRSEPTAAADTQPSPHGSHKHSQAGTPYLPPLGSFSSPLIMNASTSTSTDNSSGGGGGGGGWQTPFGGAGWWQSPSLAAEGRTDWFGAPPPVPRKSPSREFASRRGDSYSEGHGRADAIRRGEGYGADWAGNGLGLGGREFNRTF